MCLLVFVREVKMQCSSDNKMLALADSKCAESNENRARRCEKLSLREREREKEERPSAAPALVILTQIRRWNMATMWTLSRSVAPVSGGGPSQSEETWQSGEEGRTWGGSGSQESLSEKERVALKVCELWRRSGRAEEPHVQESRPMETGWTVVLFILIIQHLFTRLTFSGVRSFIPAVGRLPGWCDRM